MIEISGKKMIENKWVEKEENFKVLFSLMSFGNKSDRAISKILGFNNSIFSKRRKLEKMGYVKEYTIIPDFCKLGFEFVVFTLASTTNAVKSTQIAEFCALTNKHPQC